jgi:hypothetical protein
MGANLEESFKARILRAYSIADEIAKLGSEIDVIEMRDENHKSHNPMAFVQAIVIMLFMAPVAIFFELRNNSAALLSLVVFALVCLGIIALGKKLYPVVYKNKRMISELFVEWKKLNMEMKNDLVELKESGISTKYREDMKNLRSSYKVLKSLYTTSGLIKSFYQHEGTKIVKGIINYGIPLAIGLTLFTLQISSDSSTVYRCSSCGHELSFGKCPICGK